MSNELDVRSCALVLIDYQNDFCHLDGAVAQSGHSVEAGSAIYPQIAELIASARAAGVPRIFVRVAHSEWTDTPAWTHRASGKAIFEVPLVREGTWGAEFFKIEPQPDELVMTKHRLSAFLYTPLKLVLQAKQVRSVVLAGVQTDVCVRAIALDAMQEGFVPVVVEDCVATRDDAAHDQALDEIRTRVGHVVKLSDIRSAWGS